MKKIILLVVFALGLNLANAQTDKIYKHSGEVVEGKVIRLDEYTIVFKYDGEDAENTIENMQLKKSSTEKLKDKKMLQEKL